MKTQGINNAGRQGLMVRYGYEIARFGYLLPAVAMVCRFGYVV